ncbi:MAG: DUF1080 domain-containing protein [Bacteroidota bacterium]
MIIAVILLSGCSAIPKDKGWQSLFNGKDLSQWTVKCHEEDKDKKAWFVEEGVVVGQTFDTTHQKIWLYSDKTYYNFKLRFKYQVEEGNPCNSGVVLRGLWDPTAHDGKGVLNGPQVDISSRGWDGAIYDETIGSREWLVKETSKEWTYWAPQWNEMLIEFVDTRLTVWINGSKVTEYNGSGWFDDLNHKNKNVACVAGHIGLQIHAPEIMKISYKDIEIKELVN